MRCILGWMRPLSRLALNVAAAAAVAAVVNGHRDPAVAAPAPYGVDYPSI